MSVAYKNFFVNIVYNIIVSDRLMPTKESDITSLQHLKARGKIDNRDSKKGEIYAAVAPTYAE